MSRTWWVSGASGRLGCHVVAHLEGAGITAVGASRRPHRPGDAVVDLADPTTTVATLDAVRPSLVLHLAACSSVKQARTTPREAWLVNVDATARIARWCHDRGVRMVLVSSDFVFPGRPGGAYREDDRTGPVNDYGRGKVAAERAVLALPDALVLRSSFLYGAVDEPGSLLARVVAHARYGAPLEVTARELRTPLHVDDAARALVHLARSDTRGIVNLAGPSVLSAADLAREVCSWAGVPLRARNGDAVAPRPDRPGDVSLNDARMRSLGVGWVRPFGPWALEELRPAVASA